jgi:hypothetical protein
MKQTAVDWFALKVMYLKMNPKEVFDFIGWLEEAKEIERMQIKDAYSAGVWEIGYFNGKADAKEYYNKTYENK